jgi:hypothetical protein
MNLNGLLSYLVTGLIVYFFWLVNARTRRKIDRWAKENGIDILHKIYVPWHWYFPLCGGFHPANFRIIAKNSDGEKESYWILGGGSLWLSDELKVEKSPKHA